MIFKVIMSALVFALSLLFGDVALLKYSWQSFAKTRGKNAF